MESFSVHLLSNVSPGLFPDNSPSKFSTYLANEINLPEGEWEVGVRQIMYPTHVATTSMDDKIDVYKYEESYRNLLPHPSRDKVNLQTFGASININGKQPFPSTSTLDSVADYVLQQVNASVWSKQKGVLKMEYDRASKKFILHIDHEDILVAFTNDLTKLLGFTKTNFVKGIHSASSQFTNPKVNLNDIKMNLYDLTTFESESHELVLSIDQKGSVSYIKSIPRNYKDTLPDEYHDEPTFRFGVHVNSGMIKTTAESTSHKSFESHEKKVLFYSFDSASTKKFDLESIYAHHEGKVVPIPKQPLLNVKKEQSTSETPNPIREIKRVRVTFYYDHARDIARGFEKMPIASFSIDTKKQLRKPTDLIPKLNEQSKTYQYKFHFDTTQQRFMLTLGNKYGLRLNKSLASILGFESNPNVIYEPNTKITAQEFPILNRGITALYVYTNIIQSVYIGDVQAPLLLTCPFKNKESKDDVHQLEFLNPYYAPLNRSVVNQIDIAIYDDSGSLIPFLYGKTKLSLDFRRKS